MVTGSAWKLRASVVTGLSTGAPWLCSVGSSSDKRTLSLQRVLSAHSVASDHRVASAHSVALEDTLSGSRAP